MSEYKPKFTDSRDDDPDYVYEDPDFDEDDRYFGYYGIESFDASDEASEEDTF